VREHAGLHFGIPNGATNGLEVNAASCALPGFCDAAPIGRNAQDAFNMPRGGDYGQSFERVAVGGDLSRQARESILRAFYLVAVETAIDDSDIDATPSVGKAKLVNDEDFLTRPEATELLAVKGGPDLSIGKVLLSGWHLGFSLAFTQRMPDLRLCAKGGRGHTQD
jgi:hypothetical protein